LRILSNDLDAPAQGDCRSLQRRLGDRAVLRWVKQTLKFAAFSAPARERRAHFQDRGSRLIAFLLLRGWLRPDNGRSPARSPSPA